MDDFLSLFKETPAYEYREEVIDFNDPYATRTVYVPAVSVPTKLTALISAIFIALAIMIPVITIMINNAQIMIHFGSIILMMKMFEKFVLTVPSVYCWMANNL